MKNTEYRTANRRAWNEAAPVHAKLKFTELLADVGQTGFNHLDDTETQILLDIGVAGRSVAHLCCNNGLELLSIKKLGAGRCVGFDISDAFIGQARELSDAGGIECEFVRTDVYAMPATYDDMFDLVYISVGTLGWMPDLGEFFRVIQRLLAPQGRLFIYEMHPMLDMFDPDENDPPLLKHSYFRDEPYVDEEGLDYYGGTTYKSSPCCWFHHKMSDIIQGCLDIGLAIELFQEYPHDVSAEFAHFQEYEIKPALSYVLSARMKVQTDPHSI